MPIRKAELCVPTTPADTASGIAVLPNFVSMLPSKLLKKETGVTPAAEAAVRCGITFWSAAVAINIAMFTISGSP
jgi:hypothetical protein